MSAYSLEDVEMNERATMANTVSFDTRRAYKSQYEMLEYVLGFVESKVGMAYPVSLNYYSTIWDGAVARVISELPDIIEYGVIYTSLEPAVKLSSRKAVKYSHYVR